MINYNPNLFFLLFLFVLKDMAMNRSNRDFLELYLKSIKTVSPNSNTVICDDKDYVLYAKDSLTNKQDLNGLKLKNLNISKNTYIQKEEIKSPFSGELLFINYKLFEQKGDLEFDVKLQEKIANKFTENQVPSNNLLNIDQWRKKLDYLGFDDSDLKILLMYVFSYNLVYGNSNNTKIKIFDINNKIIYENTHNINQKFNFANQITTTENILSMSSGKLLGKIECGVMNNCSLS